MAKITYTNKVTLNEQPSVADINKVTDDDMNEIKNVVNTNDDNVGTLSNLKTTEKTSTVAAINELIDSQIYSLNEVKTNKVWIDGKPIYRKVFSQTNKNSIDLTSLNYDYLRITNTTMVTSGYVRNPYYTSNSDYFRILITSDKELIIQTNVNIIDSWTTILEYTKAN